MFTIPKEWQDYMVELLKYAGKNYLFQLLIFVTFC